MDMIFPDDRVQMRPIKDLHRVELEPLCYIILITLSVSFLIPTIYRLSSLFFPNVMLNM